MRLISFWNWVMIYRIFGASPERWRVCDWISCCVRPPDKVYFIITNHWVVRLDDAPESRNATAMLRMELLDDRRSVSHENRLLWCSLCVRVNLEYSISKSTLMTAIYMENERNFFFYDFLGSWLMTWFLIPCFVNPPSEQLFMQVFD